MSDTRLILHVKGTESQTTELPRQVVRAAISQGQITHSQLIWCPTDSAWKQVREMPDLLPSQRMAPVPPRGAIPFRNAVTPDSPNNPVARAAESAGVPVAKPRIAGGTGPTPKVVAKVVATGAPKAVAAGTPQVRAAATAKPAAQAAVMKSSGKSVKVKEDDDFHPVKWLCIGLGGLILVVLALNFVFIDQPLTSKFSQTSLGKVKVYAHLAAFVQPNVILIHVPASPDLNSDNLGEFLSDLARSTPQNPITASSYDRVTLTSAWTAQYGFSSQAWKQLGQMTNQDDEQRRDFILTQIGDPSGMPILSNSSSPDAQEKRDNLWKALVAHFSTAP